MIVIIGAGPAGLAVAHYLQQHKREFIILEKEAVGNSWRNHYDSLHLHTLKEVSQLPGHPFPEGTSKFPSRQEFLDYLVDYAEAHRFDIRSGVTVKSATFNQNQSRWEITTNKGALEADKLVVATGIWSNPNVPSFIDQRLFGGPIVHANDYFNHEPYLGKRVLVVGVGNTGADIAVELADNGIEVGIAITPGADFVPYPTSAAAMRVAATLFRTLPASVGNKLLARPDFSDIGLPGHPLPPTEAYPVVGFKLPEAIRDGRVRAHPGIDRLSVGTVCFTDGVDAQYDAIVLATGYRPAIRFLGSASAETQLDLDERGWPIVDKQFRSTRNRSLYLAGFDYPATSGWIQNMSRVARIIGRSLAK